MASPKKKWLRMKASEDAAIAAVIMMAPTTTTVATEAIGTTSKTKTRTKRARTTKKG